LASLNKGRTYGDLVLKVFESVVVNKKLHEGNLLLGLLNDACLDLNSP
jgi:hypothetical protein